MRAASLMPLLPLVLGAVLPLTAQAACPSSVSAKPPVVYVAVEHGRITRDDTLGLAGLAQLRRENSTTAGESATMRVLGLTRSDTEFRLSLRSRVATPPDGGAACAILEAVEVRLVLLRRVVNIAREVAGDACLRDEVLAHEMRHVRTDDALLDDYRARLLPRFREAAAVLRPAEAATAEAAQRMLLRDMQAANGAALADFEAERRMRQAAIDSPRERARFASVCGGRARALHPES